MVMSSGAVKQGRVFGALVASFPLAYVVWQTQVCARHCGAGRWNLNLSPF